MSLQPVSIGSLNRALERSEETIIGQNQEISHLTIQLAFNLGRKFEALKNESSIVDKEILLHNKRIEVIESTHQEKWTACIELFDKKQQAFPLEIAKIIQSIGTFAAELRKKVPGGNGVDRIYEIERNIKSIKKREYFCNMFIPKLEVWRKQAQRAILFDDEAKKHPQYSPVPVPERVRGNNTIPIDVFSELSPLVNDLKALDAEVALKKEELDFLKQSIESKEKDHQISIKRLKYTFIYYVALKHWTMATQLKTFLEDYDKDNPTEPSEGNKSETLRVAGMIDAIITRIKQDEWRQEI